MPAKVTEKLSDFSRLVFLLARYARPYWKCFFLLIAVNLLLTFLSVLPPVIMAPIVDILFGTGESAQTAASDPSLIGLSLNNLGRAVLGWMNLESASKFKAVIILSLLYLLVGTLKNITHFGAYFLALWIRVRTSRDMQQDLFQHILSMSMGFFTKQRTGELLSRMDTDTQATTYSFEGIISNIILCPIIILVYTIMLLKTNMWLAFAAVGGGIMHYAVSKLIQRPVRKHATDQFTVFADLRAWLQEAVLGIRVVKSFGAEEYESRRLYNAVTDVNRVNMKLGVYKHVEGPVRGVVDRFVQVGVMLFATHEFLDGNLTRGGFFLFLYVVQALMEPVSKLGLTYTIVQTTLAASERVFALFAQKPAIVDGPQPVSGFDDSLTFENVSFAYEDAPVLKDVNITVGKGQVVALVGPSGAGKSTISDLALRFYDPAAGRVLIDGTDLREFRQNDYRRLFGVVSQESLLFNATIRENIAYSREDLSHKDIERAAKIANAHDFIMELPDGYETLVGDRGIRLSGGQRQRIAIARAVVAKPQILMLDEATSALDSESEKLVQEAIDRVIKGSTALVIAHRLSTVIHADKIVVLDQGIVVDQGKHSELLSRCGLYQRLCELQFGTAGA